MGDSSCTVILPTYKEAGNIQKMAMRLRELYPDFFILIMDDNSGDGSKELIDDLNDPMIKFIERDPDDRGLSASIFQGITEAGTEFFINMDSDFQHPPEAVGPAYKRLLNGADLCVGIREDRTALSPVRWLASWGAHFMAAMTLWLRDKKKSGDIMSGFFGGRTELYQSVILAYGAEMDKKGFKALFDLLKFGPSEINIGEIAFVFGKREAGESKLNKTVILSVLRQCEPFGKLMARVAGRFT
ncbi:MAG: glycosyltransferase [Methanomassiliicoccaceae archaeon]|nr:glycosyltransferase [Methanomassiliicoccaceae archaeon]